MKCEKVVAEAEEEEAVENITSNSFQWGCRPLALINPSLSQFHKGSTIVLGACVISHQHTNSDEHTANSTDYTEQLHR